MTLSTPLNYLISFLLFLSFAFILSPRLARSVFDEAENLGFNLKLLDIGGGFPGISTVTSTLYDSSDSESEDSSRGTVLAEKRVTTN